MHSHAPARTLNLLLILSAGFLINSCSNPSGLDMDQTVTISELGWILESIPNDFWSAAPHATAFLNMGCSFAEQDLAANEFEEIVITAPGGTHWNFSGNKLDRYFDPENSTFGPWVRMYDPDLGDGDCLRIGVYTIEATLKNGYSDSADLRIPAPGSTSTGVKNRAYSEDYRNSGHPASNEAPLPLRAEIDSATRSSTEVSVEFSVNDSLIYNGFIWFYDSSGDYIGITEHYFRDFSTGDIDPMIPSGSLENDGSTNTVSLSASDIRFQQGRSWGDINAGRIVLTDGEQYAGELATYDTRSISEEFSISN